MSKKPILRPLLLSLAFAGTVGAAQAAPLPPLQHQGPVAYLSGGVGHDEARSIESAASNWPLVLEFAVKDRAAGRDAFLADVAVQVSDAQGRTVLDTVSDGPFVLAKLAPGRYHVKASFDGRSFTRTVQVGSHGTTRAVFVWPHAAEDA